MLRLTLLICMGLLLSGCATYEFQLVQPETLTRHVGSKEETSFTLDDLVYHMQAIEGRMVMRIENPGDVPVLLDGQRSSVVDSKRQSRPLRGQSIAPRSFVKLIFPPLRARYRAEPTIGIGFGVGVSRFHHGGYYAGYAGDFYDEPLYLDQVSGDEATNWDWEGETTVRIHLAFQRGDKPLQHEFEFKRQKM